MLKPFLVKRGRLWVSKSKLLMIYFLPIFVTLEVITRIMACIAVTYLENNRAGITVFGFMLDRTWLHTIFGIELGLLLWLLNKTIGISHP